MKYFLSAGEASGDLHASQLVKALREADPESQFAFLGGSLMAYQAGCEPVIHYRDMAFMGFIEVVRHGRRVLSNLSKAKRAIKRERPDALILVDYPSFNLKLAAYANRLGIPTFYYISPKVWAWKEYRVKQIRRLVKRVFCILPFEPKFYRERHDYEAIYVGNPSVEEVDARIASAPSREEFCARHGLDPARPIIAIVPGSRRAEIKQNLMIMELAAATLADHQPVVAGAPAIDGAYYGYYITPGTPVVHDATFDLMLHAEMALVTSGTATLECALMSTPQVVCYRSLGTRLAYHLFERLLKVKYVSLPNLIADAEIVPEMLLHRCTPHLVAKKLMELQPGRPGRDNQLDGYRLMRSRLGTANAAATTARAIIDQLTGGLEPVQ